MKRNLWYTLEGHKPKPVSLEQWGQLFSEENLHKRVVGKTSVGEVEVSTVFLGVDHNFSNTGPPILFETMIFGGKHDQYQERYATWEEAEAMHKAACELAFHPKWWEFWRWWGLVTW